MQVAHHFCMAGGIDSHTPSKAPVHLWVVGLLLVLWNAWGVALAIGVQTRQLSTMSPEDVAFFEAQPLWIVIVADLGDAMFGADVHQRQRSLGLGT